MTIKALLATRTDVVISCRAEESVGTVVARLVERRIGAVPVLHGAGDTAEVVGIFSERDAIRCMAEHGPASVDCLVGDVMTAPPVTVSADTGIMAALSLMTRRRFRHLPVIEDGRLAGFVSIGDLVKYRIDEVEAEAAAMRQYIAS